MSKKWNSHSIREMRRTYKLTQSQLANALGCRQQTVSEWEVSMYAPQSAYQQLLTLFFSDHERIRKARDELPQ